MNAAGFVAVGLGALLGAWSRWGLSAALNHLWPALPPGIGAAFELFTQQATLPLEWKLFFITGFLGSLTTFSAFSLEAVNLLQSGRYGWALALIASHLFGSLLMTVAGFATVRILSA